MSFHVDEHQMTYQPPYQHQYQQSIHSISIYSQLPAVCSHVLVFIHSIINQYYHNSSEMSFYADERHVT